ncbi:MAG: HU family DNA-binding protein, partial [Alphaproteobacteria bacterium]
FIEHLQTSLSQGEKISLPGVGQFEIAERAARQGRNPQTGETISIPASKAVKFKAGKALKDAVNG